MRNVHFISATLSIDTEKLKKVSKKARRMIKDLVKEKKRNVKLPSSFKNQLSASERSQVSKGGEQILSNLLYGRGLAIM